MMEVACLAWRHRGALVTLVLGWLVFCSFQFAPDATIQWDAVDVHYASQAYASDQLRGGNLPVWTAALFSGFPFLADPQVGAWYPLNWPFFALGVSPRSIQFEIALHTLLACVGAYALSWRLMHHRPGAVFSGFSFGLSGYFAAHAEHVGMLQTAAWLPWLLLLVHDLAARPRPARVALAGLVGGGVILAGHFQAALFDVTAMALFAACSLPRARHQWQQLTIGLVTAAVLALGVSAVLWLPGLELAGESVRSQLDASTSTFGLFRPEGLLTLVSPNALGALFGDYTGPVDISQYYWYAGLLTLPLALVGLIGGPARVRVLSTVLIGPFCWYALGPSAGLYTVVSHIPGFDSVQGPVNGWFVPALGVSLLAGSGLSWCARRLPWLERRAAVLLVLIVLDLTFWNSAANRLAFARVDPQNAYLSPVAAMRADIEALGISPVRLHGDRLTRVGYLNQTLQAGAESTYGYNPLELRSYYEYMLAAQRNPSLIDALAATHFIDVAEGTGDALLRANPSELTFATLPPRIVTVPDSEHELDALLTSNPATTAIVQASASVDTGPPASSDSVRVVERSADHARLDYSADAPVLVRLAIPSYPGWHVRLDGTELRTLTVDHTLLGFVAPAGQGAIDVSYVPTRLYAGAIISAATLAIVGVLAMGSSTWSHRRM